MYIYKRDQPDEELEKRHARSKMKELVATIGIIVAAPLLALILTAYVFQAYEVDGPSMHNTLYDNDRLLVLKVQRTWARVTGNPYIPKRYDIVVFNHKDNYGLGGVTEKQLIKRVVALPGERVVVKDGKVTVYNDENPRGFDVDAAGADREHIVGTTAGNIDQTIQAGEIFLLGDNRENSLDSRSFGAIPANDIAGRLAARVFPFNSAERF